MEEVENAKITARIVLCEYGLRELDADIRSLKTILIAQDKNIADIIKENKEMREQIGSILNKYKE